MAESLWSELVMVAESSIISDSSNEAPSFGVTKSISGGVFGASEETI